MLKKISKKLLKKIVVSLESKKFLRKFYFIINTFLHKFYPSIIGIIYSNKIYKFDIEKSKYAKYRICHIFGNGSSVLNTCLSVNPNDFVISMNSGIALPIPPNILLLELDSHKNYFKHKIMYDAFAKSALRLSNKHNTIVLLKNIWFSNIRPPKIYNNKSVRYLQDYLYGPGPFSSDYANYVLKNALDDDSNIICQIGSSALTAINIAVKLGFKDIVIHGLDGGGDHFFHSNIYDDCKDSDISCIVKISRFFITKELVSKSYKPGKLSADLLSTVTNKLKSSGITVKNLSVLKFG